MKFEPYPNWTTVFSQAGVFNHLNTLFSLSQKKAWPSLTELNQHAKGITQNNGLQIEFTAQDDIDWQHGNYEEIIFNQGQIPTRLNNWHDLFGAYIWLLFPKTKALLNQLHIEEITLHGKQTRSKKRNAITLLDECGIIIPYLDESLVDALKTHQWQNAFVDNRMQWGSRIDAFMFGHANYEMATKPFLGLTGKGLYIAVGHNFFEWSLKSQYAYLDEQLVKIISTNDTLKDNQALFPMPFLGIPNWYDENQNESFYENTAYFRPQRRKSQ